MEKLPFNRIGVYRHVHHVSRLDLYSSKLYLRQVLVSFITRHCLQRVRYNRPVRLWSAPNQRDICFLDSGHLPIFPVSVFCRTQNGLLPRNSRGLFRFFNGLHPCLIKWVSGFINHDENVIMCGKTRGRGGKRCHDILFNGGHLCRSSHRFTHTFSHTVASVIIMEFWMGVSAPELIKDFTSHSLIRI